MNPGKVIGQVEQGGAKSNECLSEIVTILKSMDESLKRLNENMRQEKTPPVPPAVAPLTPAREKAGEGVQAKLMPSCQAPPPPPHVPGLIVGAFPPAPPPGTAATSATPEPAWSARPNRFFKRLKLQDGSSVWML